MLEGAGPARASSEDEVPGLNATDPTPSKNELEKFERLKSALKEMGSVLVAFSGGVDSTFLLKVAHDTLGDKAVAMTATSPTYPEREFEEAKTLATEIGAKHIIVESNELDIPGFADNSSKRCYFCKGELFKVARGEADALGLGFVLDGSNIDDTSDYRPGKEAAIELGVRSPLEEALLTKDEIRRLSRSLALSTWDKPNFACLSSRFPYGTAITEEGLGKVGLCEDILRELGFTQLRVRYHGDTARIEVPEEAIKRFLDDSVREEVVSRFKEAGFIYVTLDLAGYRIGSMNEVLKPASLAGGEKE